MKNKRFTQLLCTLLAVLMLMGALPVMSSSAEHYHTKESDYNRYYFYMPESWYNEYERMHIFTGGRAQVPVAPGPVTRQLRPMFPEYTTMM